MNILIVEDDAIYADALEILLLELKAGKIFKTDDSEEALRMINAIRPNLILLDITLNGKWSGVQIAEIIREKQLPITMIFITSSKDEDVFEKAKLTTPFAYINKPLDKEAFKKTILLALQQQNNFDHFAKLNDSNSNASSIISDHYFFVKTKKTLKKIEISTILFIEVFGKYCEIVLENDSINVKTPLKDIAAKIDHPKFQKINRSCIINIEKIESFDMDNNTILIGNYKISIARRLKKKLISILQSDSITH